MYIFEKEVYENSECFSFESLLFNMNYRTYLLFKKKKFYQDVTDYYILTSSFSLHISLD